MKSYVRNTAVGLVAVVLGACGGGSGRDTAATSFASVVDGSDALLAVVVDQDEGKVLAYVCDGKAIATWFTGAQADDGTLALTAADGARLMGRIDGGEVSGMVTFPGDPSPHAFKAPAVLAPAGLYRTKGDVRGEPAVGGWIVLADGSQRGGVRTSSGFSGSETGLSKPSQPVTHFTTTGIEF